MSIHEGPKILSLKIGPEFAPFNLQLLTKFDGTPNKKPLKTYVLRGFDEI